MEVLCQNLSRVFIVASFGFIFQLFSGSRACTKILSLKQMTTYYLINHVLCLNQCIFSLTFIDSIFPGSSTTFSWLGLTSSKNFRLHSHQIRHCVESQQGCAPIVWHRESQTIKITGPTVWCRVMSCVGSLGVTLTAANQKSWAWLNFRRQQRQSDWHSRLDRRGSHWKWIRNAAFLSRCWIWCQCSFTLPNTLIRTFLRYFTVAWFSKWYVS